MDAVLRDLDLLILCPPPYGPAPLPRRMLSILRRRIMGQPVAKYGGHEAVMRSVVDGLHASNAGIRWAFRTRYRGETAKVLHIIADPTYVEIGIEAKRAGKCDKLVVGPIITRLPSEHNRIQTRPEIDQVIVASERMIKRFSDIEPVLEGKLVAWPSGVDADLWKPPAHERTRVIVYVKRREKDAPAVISLLHNAGYELTELYYGRYTLGQFREALEQAFAMVVLNDGESQGIFLHEAWSMDVPTFVGEEIGKTHASAAPTLNDATGAFWTEPEEILGLLAQVSRHTPRAWTLQHGTDQKSAEHLLRIVGLA